MKIFSAIVRWRGGTRGWWPWVLCVIAIAYAWPIATRAYEELVELNLQARVGLIEHHRLWEMQPDFRGKPEMWTRIASRLLSDSQLLRRVAAKYGAAADEIEIEYRRDVAIARTELVFSWFLIWAGPLAALGALAVLVQRRGRAPPPPPQSKPPASISDPRYLPPPNR